MASFRDSEALSTHIRDAYDWTFRRPLSTDILGLNLGVPPPSCGPSDAREVGYAEPPEVSEHLIADGNKKWLAK